MSAANSCPPKTNRILILYLPLSFVFPREVKAQYLVMKLSVRPVIKARPTQTLPKLSLAVLLRPDLIVRKVAVRFFGDEHAKSTGVLLIVSEEQGGLYLYIGKVRQSEK